MEDKNKRVLTKKYGYDVHRATCGLFYGRDCDEGQVAGAFICEFCMEGIAWCADCKKYSNGPFGCCLDCYAEGKTVVQ